MGNQAEVERLLVQAEGLLEEADRLWYDAVHGHASLAAAMADWKARAGPLFGELNARVSKLLSTLSLQVATRQQELSARHARALRRLERQEHELTRAGGSPELEALRQRILDEAEQWEEKFLTFEQSRPTPADLKSLEFHGKVDLSALERQVGQAIRALAPSEQHETKMVMRALRDFFKEATADLHRHLEGELPLSARRKFRHKSFARIPAAVVDGSKPFPKDTSGKSGLFYHAYPSGQLKLLARLRDGQVQRSLFLFDGVAEGQYRAGGEVEHFNSDGTLEVCHALYQHDPKPAGMPFASWAIGRAHDVAGR